MSAILTTASFRAQEAIEAGRTVINQLNHAHFAMDSVRNVRAVLAGVLKGASALYISFASFTEFGPDAIVSAAVAAKKGNRPLFTYLRPNLPETALDIDSPEFQVFLNVLPHVDVLQLTSDELFYFCPAACNMEDASTQICQRFNLKALVVFDNNEGTGFVASREMVEPVQFICRPTHYGNIEDQDGHPSHFSRHILYGFLEQGGTKSILSSKDLTTLIRDAANAAASAEPAYLN